MVDKQKHARATTQRKMSVSMLESTTASLTGAAHLRLSSCDEGGIHQIPNEHEARHDGGEGASYMEDRS